MELTNEQIKILQDNREEFVIMYGPLVYQMALAERIPPKVLEAFEIKMKVKES